MSNTRESNFEKDDVVVAFPASKNYRAIDDLKNPLESLKDDIEKAKTFQEKINLELPNELSNLEQACHSLDVRLRVLDEVKDRLKFFMDDLENELLRKHYD